MNASAEFYSFTGNLVFDDYFDHGSTGTFDIVLETASPIGTGFVDVIGASGTFFGNTVVGLNSFTGDGSLDFFTSDQKIGNGTNVNYFADYEIGGLSLSFTPLTGSSFATRNDNNVKFSQYLGEYFASIGSTSLSNDWSSDYTINNISLNPIAAVPEPETYAMFLAGLGLLGFAARRKQA